MNPTKLVIFIIHSKITKLCRYISKRDIVKDMFKKIIKKLQFGSCKTQVANDVNAFKESEKKKPEDVEK